MLHRINQCKTDCLPECIWNISALQARIASFEDSNQVVWKRADGSKECFLLNRQEVIELNVQPGDKFYSKFHLSGSGRRNAAAFELVPEYIASDEAGFNVSRSGRPQLSILSLGATSVRIFFNDILQSTVSLTPNQVTTHTPPTANGNYYLEANGEFIAQKTAGVNADPGTIFRPSNDVIGWISTVGYLSSRLGGSAFRAFHVNTNGSLNQNANNPFNILTFADFANFANTEDEYYEPTSAVRILGQNLYGFSRADSDGGADTAFLPTDLLRNSHLIPQPSEFISIESIVPTTVTVTLPNGNVSTLTLAKGSTSVNAPFSGRLGSANGQTNFPAGVLIESGPGINIVYQPKGAGGFSSDDDETLSIGYNQ